VEQRPQIFLSQVDIFMNKNGTLHIETSLIHHQRVELPKGNIPLVTPLHQSVKYRPASLQHARDLLSGKGTGFIYSRVSNPTVRELEILLASIQGREEAICTASGIGALAAVAMSFLKQGDRVLVFTESYKPTRYLLSNILSKFGIETIRLLRDDYQTYEKLLRGSNPPKMVFLESPTNPSLRLHDLKFITSLARLHDCLTVLDNTFAGFLAHGSFDIDIFVHSLTKQAGGHSDAMGGCIIAKSELIKKIFPIAITLGACLDPHSAWLILRGMKTYALRTRESSKTTHELAKWLKIQPWAEKIRYPALADHPDHQLWLDQSNGDGGSVVTFDLKAPTKSFDRFFDHLKLITLTPSLGCVETLAAPCMLFFGDDLSKEEAEKAGISEMTIRLAIGIENLEDLKDDLMQAAHAALNN
jgi:cystathionine beta-lyase/cystathionine gamma-synthase